MVDDSDGAGDHAGEQDAFYRAHRTDAVRWARALVGQPMVAEEIAHDALIAVASRLASVREPGAYLRRTVVHRAASWHRTHRRELRRLRRDAAGRPTAYTDETNEMLEALAVLPYRQRAAVTLRYWADWSDDQIADAIGCAPATVRVLLHRGLATLKKEIGKKEIGE